jgi:hypothetical protein
VLGAGTVAATLWVQALPAPGIRAVVPLPEAAAIEQETDGPQRRLIITGRAGWLLVRYDASGGRLADALARRLAGDPAPVPGDATASGIWPTCRLI